MSCGKVKARQTRNSSGHLGSYQEFQSIYSRQGCCCPASNIPIRKIYSKYGCGKFIERLLWCSNNGKYAKCYAAVLTYHLLPRILSLSVSGLMLIHHVSWSSTFCTSSNLEFGRPFSHTLYASFMPQAELLMIQLLSLTDGKLFY